MIVTREDDGVSFNLEDEYEQALGTATEEELVDSAGDESRKMTKGEIFNLKIHMLIFYWLGKPAHFSSFCFCSYSGISLDDESRPVSRFAPQQG